MRFVTPNGIEVTLKEWNGEFMKVATKLFQSKHPKIVQEIVTRFCVESIAGESDLERITSLTEIDIMAILIASRAYSFRFDPYVPIEKDWTGKDKKRFTHTHQIPLKYENLPIVYAQNVLANPDNRLFGKDKQAKYFDLDMIKYETLSGKKGKFQFFEYLQLKEVEGENVIDFILFETDITNDEITLLNSIELSEFVSDITEWETAKDSIQPIYESLDEYIEGLKYEVKLPAGERLKMTKPTLEFSNSYLKGKVSEGDFDTLILLRQPQLFEGIVKFDIKNFSHAEKEYINKQIKTKEGSIDMKAKVSNPTNASEVETVAYLMTLGFFSPSQA